VTTTTATRERAKEATASPVFEGLARAGYLARGVIYILVGVLAFRIAEGIGSKPASQQGALRTIADQTFGHALLLVMAIGLAGYAVFRLTQAFIGETPEAGKQSAFDRIGALGSAVAYGAFCAIAISLLLGGSSGGGQHSPQKTTAGALGWPAGRELVGLAGLIFIGVGLYQAYFGLSRKFLEQSHTGQMSEAVRRAFTILGVVGFLARGVAFGLIGLFVLKAAIDFNPRQAVGLDGALGRLSSTWGTPALIVVACGLIAFGAYSVADARYRKI
jgi:Domain of Unknown Function (DUF1206)